MSKEKNINTAFFNSLKDKSLSTIREKPPFNDFATNSQKVFNRCQTFNLKPSHFYHMTEGDYKLFMARRGVGSEEQYHLYLSNKEPMINSYYFAAILEPNEAKIILPNWKKDAATEEDIKNINKCLTILERTTPLYRGHFDE